MSLLEMNQIEKNFNTVKVLHGVDFVLQDGSVHALMGENGAGKSTLMKILAGMYRCDSGTIKIKGEDVTMISPKHSQELGVAMIHQELSAIPEMTVGENIFLGREPQKGLFLDHRKLYRMTEELLHSLNVNISPRIPIGKLKVADQQMIEIAKAISLNAEIIVMDEPTSAISDKEVEALFRVIEDLKKKGKGIIYISHKMDEIFRVADDITVLRDGHYVNTWQAKDINQSVLIQNMVGRELTEIFPERISDVRETRLEIKNFAKIKKFENISFSVKEGEILGVSGLVGAGRTELMNVLFGLEKKDAGEIVFEGKEVVIKDPKDAIKLGIAYVTEDRKSEGLTLEMSTGANITLASLQELSNGLFLNEIEENKYIDSQIEKLRIRVNTPKQIVKSLSGGNQQKVVISKWLMKKPKLLILDEPTRGIDIGAKSEIYRLMGEYVAEGNSIIMVSSEMPELIGMADRMIILSNGYLSGELTRDEFVQETIMKMAVQHI